MAGTSSQRQLAGNMPLQRPESFNASLTAPVDRMRGQIGKRETKPKRTLGKRLLKIKKTMHRPIPMALRNVETNESARQRVQLALAKFNELLSLETQKTSTATTQVLKRMQTSYSNLVSTIGKVGHVPGVDVGDCFNWRAELKLVGLHGELRNGIHWKDVKEVNWRDVQFRRTDGNIESIATSVVFSGEYEDNVDQGGTLIYSDEGGRDRGAKHQTKDQKLVGGNLALYNNWFRMCPVRVIKGRPNATGMNKKLFFYDGLYKVTEKKKEKGKSGFDVYKFTLTREDGQGELAGIYRS